MKTIKQSTIVNRLGRTIRTVGFVVCALFLAMSASTALAQSVTVREIVVEGALTTDQQLVKNVSGLTPGKTIAREDIQRAVHQIYGLGLFEDVRIEGEDVTGQLRVIIKVKEFPRLAQIVYEGNEELKDKDFVLALKTGQKVSPTALKEAANAIEKVYQEKGFYLIDVTATTRPSVAADEVDAVFTIKENQPVKVSSVEFIGSTQIDSEDLIKKLKNKPRGFLKSVFGGGHFNREKYSEDLKAITDLYKKKGYIDAVVVSDTIILNPEKTHVAIQFTVNEGPRYYFGTTSFAGMSILTEDRLRKTMKYDQGDVYDQEDFDETQQGIYDAYLEEGHLYARVIEEIKTLDSTVNITFEVSEGVAAHINRVDIVGNTKTKDKVIRRELVLYPGQVFRRSLLQRSLRNVMLLNYFTNATPEFNQLPDGRVDLAVRVEEKPTGQIQVGGGYSEQDKFVGTVDLGVPNLLGNGQSANFLIEFGKRRQSYRLGFTEPWLFDTPTSVGFDVSRLERTFDEPSVVGTDDFTETSTGFTTRLGRRLTWPDDYFSVYANYRLQDLEYSDLSDSIDALSYNLSDGVISSSAFSVTRDSRDLPEFATKGSRATYRTEFSGGVLGGDWNYTKHNFTYSFYKKIWKGFVFSPVWNLGAIQADPGSDEVPYTELFYGGGIRSDGMIRGYSDRSIIASINPNEDQPSWSRTTDPVIGDTARYRFNGSLRSLDPDGRASGPYSYQANSLSYRAYGENILQRGKALGVMNAQIVFPLVSQQIHGLLFFDAGNVWGNVTDMNLGDLYTSYGFGFRMAVPGIGLLGFDFGIPLRTLGNDQKGKLKPHFQFGGSF